jgi:cobalt/nickel transport system permease protein
MIPPFLLQQENTETETKAARHKLSFIDRTMRNMATFISTSFYQWHTSNSSGLLQGIDPRVKVLFLLGCILLVNLSHSIAAQSAVAVFILLLYVFSGINVISVYQKILVTGFLFGFLIFAPSALNTFTKGEILFTLWRFPHAYTWWVYRVPEVIAVTREGLFFVLKLTFKVINSVAVVLLVMSTTSFERIVKALSFFKVPGIMLLTLTMSYKFIFILSQTVAESYRAMKMRWWNHVATGDARNIVMGRIGYLFRKSWERYELVYQSMTARGFDGNVNFAYFDRLKRIDYLFLLFLALFIASIVVVNARYG